MIVVDASAILEVLLGTPAADAVSERLFREGETWHAPHLLDLEVAQVLRRFAAAGEMADDRGRVALEDLQQMPLTRYPHAVFLPRVWDLRHNFSAYDAAYLALAEALGAPLVTRDARLAAAPSLEAVVEVL
ncbi:MAG: type II toxin-antitoxin system VapC family toxin [Gemmatimonadota bacterium]